MPDGPRSLAGRIRGIMVIGSEVTFPTRSEVTCRTGPDVTYQAGSEVTFPTVGGHFPDELRERGTSTWHTFCIALHLYISLDDYVPFICVSLYLVIYSLIVFYIDVPALLFSILFSLLFIPRRSVGPPGHIC